MRAFVKDVPAYESLGRPAQQAVWLAAAARAWERLAVGGAVFGLASTASLASASPRKAVVFVVAAACVMSLASAIRGAAWLRSDLLVRNDLYLAVAQRLAHADTMQPVPLPGGDAEGPLSEAVYAGARVFGAVIPGLLGDGLALAVFSVGALCFLDGRLMALAACAILAMACIALLVSRAVVRAQAGHTGALLTVHERLAELVAGREELAATGMSSDACRDLGTHLSRWQRAARDARVVGALGTRAPVLVGGLVVGALFWMFPSLFEAVLAAGRETVAAFAVGVPVVVEAARSALDLRRSGPDLEVLRQLLTLAPLATGNGANLPENTASMVARSIAFSYGSRNAIKPVSFDWAPGTILAFAGPNGAGKSTMLRLLLGLARPTAGTLRLGETGLIDLDLVAFRQTVAYVPQRAFVSKRRTVREVLSDEISGNDAAKIRALASLGFESDLAAAFLDRTMATLSSGQAQRVALARAFGSRRPRLVLDEPDANLDERSVACLNARLRELCEVHGRTIALAAHHPGLLEVADQVVTLEP